MKMNRILREKRKNLRMTQEQMAAYLGVSASAVNKWEKGSTCPDIALLPGLARLLQTDLNTLLSFKEDLCDAEIENFVNAVNETVREKGYEKGYQMAMNKIHEYPTCEPLLYSLILYLDGARFLYSVPEQEGHGEVFETFYERLSESEIPVIRETALTMLISASRNRKDFARAEELIEKLPVSSVDQEEQRAILYMRQEKYQEAEKLWERRVLEGITEAQTALMNMMEIAQKEGRMEDAKVYADIYEQASRLFCVTAWIPYIAKLQLSVMIQDREGCLSALRSVLSGLQEAWKPQDSPLYRNLSGSETNILSERLESLLREELKAGRDFDFLRGSEEFQTLLEDLNR